MTTLSPPTTDLSATSKPASNEEFGIHLPPRLSLYEREADAIALPVIVGSTCAAITLCCPGNSGCVC